MKKIRFPKTYITFSIVVFLVSTIIGLSVYITHPFGLYANNLVEEISIAPTPTKIPFPTSEIQEVAGLQTKKQKVNTYAKPNTPIVPTDPIISCQFQHLSAKQLTRSQCSISFECEINKTWYVYTSRDQCKKDQDAYWNAYYHENSNYNYTPPTYAPYSTYTPLPTIHIPTNETVVTNNTNTNQNNVYLKEQCISDANQEYRNTMNILRAKGANSSSWADEAESTRQKKINSCAYQYGAN